MEYLDKLEDNINVLVDTLNNYYITNQGITMGCLTSEGLIALVRSIQLQYAELKKVQNYTKEAKKTPSKEMVDHPTHYKGGKHECIDIMLDVFGKEKVSAFCELNAFKYQWRANNKGTNIQDKEKAIWYNQKYIELNKEKQ